MPRGHEQPGLLAEQLGGALLEGDHRRVVAEHVVADLGHAMARRIASVGRVTVSERRSIWCIAAESSGGRGRGERRPVAASGAILRLAADPWCSGPTCQPVTLEIAGSNPVGSAIFEYTDAPSSARTGRFP